MYKGTIKQQSKFKIKFPTKFQIIQTEQYENNGVIMEKLTIKTKDFSADPNIKARDFDIKNLMAINAIGDLKPCQLNKSIDMIEKEAGVANKVIEQYDIIKEIENEQLEKQTKVA